MVAGEAVQGLDGAADLGGDVVQGAVPGEVFPAEPGRVEVDHARLLAGGPGGWLGCGDEGAADRAAGPGQRVPAKDLAEARLCHHIDTWGADRAAKPAIAIYPHAAPRAAGAPVITREHCEMTVTY